jgi:ammonium transporter Rh
VVIPGIAKAQLAGIAFTIALALAGGLIADYIIRATGSKKNIYEDHEEFIQTEQKGTVLEY